MTSSEQCIIDAATNISEGKSQVASEILTRLARFSNPKGNSEERLMSYWVSALKSRVNSVENPPPVGELFYKEHVESTQLLYDMSPCFMLGFMAANLAILEATLDESDTKSDNNNRGNKIHVIDFDIGQGGQYVYLLHALAARQNGKSFIVKITAVADNSSQERLTKVGNALTQEAKKVGVCFAFKTVTILKLGELTRESLGCEPDESLVVNFAFKLYRMADESVSRDNPRDELLRRVKGLGPRVVILVEQEMNTNTAPFMARVTETCSYYGALFDSFEATMKRDNSERYVYLLHALAARQNGKSFIVKITAVADNSSQERLTKVGNALTQEAKKVGVCFAFKTVTILKLGELTRESLGCEPDESLVVNFAFKLYRMADESVSRDNPRDELLRRVKGLGPRVVILVEQEMNTNTAPFMARVTETCSYYGALFDSFEATMKRDNSERVKIEEGLGRKLGNSVACEGRDRVERCEVFGKWRARMGMAGFELKSLSQNVSETLKAKLTAENRVNPGFTVTDQNGGVCIGWMGRTLTVASAWS
ncbi:scarecrow-like protein 8 [Quercus suber]|uniref:Scarecrow-like protein 8 n=1 Tax=Quercus suber TaxID=58331 RepID=A0AAW0LQU7_QUESU